MRKLTQKYVLELPAPLGPLLKSKFGFVKRFKSLLQNFTLFGMCNVFSTQDFDIFSSFYTTQNLRDLQILNPGPAQDSNGPDFTATKWPMF